MPATEKEERNPGRTRDAAGCIVDATKRAAHLTHEAQLAKSMMQDAVEDKIYAAKRALTHARRRVEQLQDYKDDAIRYVRRRPLSAVAIALTSGLVIGVGVGWATGRRRRGETG